MEANTQKIKTNNLGIKFLVATDIHLGHQQHHTERGNDSFNAFQEILQVAKNEKIDFLLLGGDLFDQVNPSQQTIYRCLNLLKDSVFGEKDLKIQAQIYHDKDNWIPNFASQNIKIKLPIFTIHGNHDYPTTDFGKVSICDLLHASNYVNYFGKHLALQKIKIKPLIITKQNSVKLAIYGLGYLKDTVLHRLFLQKRVQFQKVENKQNTFCILILHQNRYKKGQKVGAPYLNCIDSINIPQWIDLTIWGHQHQAIEQIQIQNNRKIVQPGSTIITSFIKAQSLKKQAILINVSEAKGCQVNFIKLQKSFRPMICDNYQIEQLKSRYGQNIDLYSFLEDQVQGIIKQNHQKYPQKLPIIRLKVQTTGHDLIRFKQLEAKFSKLVANKQKIFHFWKRKKEAINYKNQKQLFEALKDKGSYDNLNMGRGQQILMILADKLQNNKKLSFFNDKKMIKFAQKCVSDDTTNTKAICQRYFEKILIESTLKAQQQVINFNKMSQKNYNKAVQQRTQNIMKNINGNQSTQQRNKRKNIQIITADQYKHSKLMKIREIQNMKITQVIKGEDIEQLTFQQQVQSLEKNNNIGQQSKNQQDFQQIILSQKKKQKQNTKIQKGKKENPKRLSILKKKEHEHKELLQSQQQDCCQRAQKTQYQQQLTKFNFKQAQQILQKKQNNKKKKNNKKSVKFMD